jgi:ubiquinol-cytochrome c reductase iron-sulfur subunit
MNAENSGRENRLTADERGPATRASDQEDRVARAENWLVFGGVLVWRAAEAVLRKLTESGPRKSVPQYCETGTAADAQAREETNSTVRGLESPAGRGLAHGAESGLKAIRFSAEALANVVEKHGETQEGRNAGEADREHDRNLDLEKGVDTRRREQRGAFLVICAMGVMAAAGFGFLFSYWTGGNNQLLGGDLALFLAGLGAALVLWAHWLTIHKEAVAPRHALDSGNRERAAAVVVFQSGVEDVQRRRLLKGMGILGTGFMAAIVVSLMKSLGFAPSTTLYSRVWQHGQRLMSLDNTPVTVNSLQSGSTMLVFPEGSIGSEKAQTVLIRVGEDLVRLPPERKNWAPQGYLAYSRVCTHAGCAVGMYEATTHLLMCPCHQSTFDVLDGAQPTGGPAARALPQLPLYADSDGVLHAADGFTEPPGPGFWGMP